MIIQDILGDIFLTIAEEIEEVRLDEKLFEAEPIDIRHQAFEAALVSSWTDYINTIKKYVKKFLRHWNIKSISDIEFEAMVKILVLHPLGKQLRFIIDNLKGDQ